MSRTIRRRRHEGKTDYKARLALLTSRKPRIVIRKTNRYVIVQLIESDAAQDKVIAGISSKSLLNNGWSAEKSGSLKSKAAAYSTGYLLGTKVKSKVKEAILDLGMHRSVPKSRLYAALKGVLDAGISVPHSKEVLPEISESEKGALKLTNKKVKE